eukprot:GHVH01016200.1.p1 GENE.GHVH01016200.1~~GHVH01016200.1.p1  ORF type:complete len:1897 (+),score=239.44 GHVH01016200.1:822-5693(+)
MTKGDDIRKRTKHRTAKSFKRISLGSHRLQYLQINGKGETIVYRKYRVRDCTGQFITIRIGQEIGPNIITTSKPLLSRPRSSRRKKMKLISIRKNLEFTPRPPEVPVVVSPPGEAVGVMGRGAKRLARINSAAWLKSRQPIDVSGSRISQPRPKPKSKPKHVSTDSSSQLQHFKQLNGTNIGNYVLDQLQKIVGPDQLKVDSVISQLCLDIEQTEFTVPPIVRSLVRARYLLFCSLPKQLKAERQFAWHIRAWQGIYKFFPESIQEARLHIHQSMTTYSLPRIKELEDPVPYTPWEKKQMQLYHSGLKVQGRRSKDDNKRYANGFKALARVQIQRRDRKEADMVYQGNCNNCRLIAETAQSSNTCFYCRFPLSEEANRGSRSTKIATNPVNSRRSLLCGLNSPAARLMECSAANCDHMAHLSCLYNNMDQKIRPPRVTGSVPRLYNKSRCHYWDILNHDNPYGMMGLLKRRSQHRKTIEEMDVPADVSRCSQPNEWIPLVDHWLCPSCQQRGFRHALESGALLPSVALFSTMFTDNPTDYHGAINEELPDIQMLLDGARQISDPEARASFTAKRVRILKMLLSRSSSHVRHMRPSPSISSFYSDETRHPWIVKRTNWVWIALELIPTIACNMAMLSQPGILEDQNLSLILSELSPLILRSSGHKSGVLSLKDIEEDLLVNYPDKEYIENYLYRSHKIKSRWSKPQPAKKKKNGDQSSRPFPVVLTDVMLSVLRTIPPDFRLSVYDSLSPEISTEVIEPTLDQLMNNAAPFFDAGGCCVCAAIARTYRMIPGATTHKQHKRDRSMHVIRYLRKRDGLESDPSEENVDSDDSHRAKKSRHHRKAHEEGKPAKSPRYSSDDIQKEFALKDPSGSLANAQRGRRQGAQDFSIVNRFGFSLTKLYSILWRLYDAFEAFYIGGRTHLAKGPAITNSDVVTCRGLFVVLPLYPRWSGVGGSHTLVDVQPGLREDEAGSNLVYLKLEELKHHVTLEDLRDRIATHVAQARAMLCAHESTMIYKNQPIPVGIDFVPSNWEEWEIANEIVSLFGHAPLIGCRCDSMQSEHSEATPSQINFMDRLEQATSRQWDSVTTLQFVIACRKVVHTSGDLLSFGMPSLASGFHINTSSDFYPMASGFPSDMVRFYIFRSIETCGILPGVTADWDNHKGVILRTNECIQENTLIGDYSGLKLPLLYSNQNWLSNSLFEEYQSVADEICRDPRNTATAERFRYIDGAVSIDGQFCGNHLNLMSGISSKKSGVTRRNVSMVWVDLNKPLVARQVDEEGRRLSNWILHGRGKLSEDLKDILVSLPYLHFDHSKDFISSVVDPVLLKLPRTHAMTSYYQYDVNELCHHILKDHELWNNWWFISSFYVARWFTDKKNTNDIGRKFVIGLDNPVVGALRYRVNAFPPCMIKDLILSSEWLMGSGWQATLEMLNQKGERYHLPEIRGASDMGQNYISNWVCLHRTSPLVIFIEIFNLLIMERDSPKALAQQQFWGVGRRDGSDWRGRHTALTNHLSEGGNIDINDCNEVDGVMNWPTRKNVQDFFASRDRQSSRMVLSQCGLALNQVASYSTTSKERARATVNSTQEGIRWMMQRDSRLLAIVNQNLYRGVELFIKYGGDFDTDGYS